MLGQLLTKGSNAAYRYGMKEGLVGFAATGAGDAMRYLGTSPYARNAIGGAALGGMYGAMSDNTSVLGGALGGAALGAGGLFAGRFAQNIGMNYGLNLKNAATNIGQLAYYKGKGALGYGLNKGKSAVASVQARMSGATIGKTAVASNQPINKITSLRPGKF